MHFIGIDLGSSSLKGGILDLDELRVSAVRRVPFPEPVCDLPPGAFEIDLATVVAATKELLGQLLAEAPLCAGILACSQMGGLVVTGERGGPVERYISWRDQRTLATSVPEGPPVLERVSETLGAERLSQLGNELRPGSMLALLEWLDERGVLPSAPLALSLGDYVVWALGQGSPVAEPTAALGMLNLRDGRWFREALATLGLERVGLPELQPFHVGAGEIRRHGRLIPVYPAVGDHQAALAGSLLMPGELSINVSTGSQVSHLTDRFIAGNYQTRPYFDGRFLNTVTHLPSGRSLQVLMDLLTELSAASGHSIADPWKYVCDAASRADDCGLAVDLAFYPGPAGDSGSITGISVDNLNVGSLFRAAYHNMAENYARAAQRVTPGNQPSRIVFSGGLVQRNPCLQELIARRLELPFRVAPSPEDTLVGLLALALVISGRARDVSDASARLAERAKAHALSTSE